MGNLKLFGGDDGRKQSKSEPAKQYAPGTQLPYDPELPDRLRQQHRNILDTLENAVAAALDRKYRHAENLLLEFQQNYRNHRFEKNQRFIPYLNHCLANDGGHSELIIKISSATRRLDQRVITTVKKHEEKGVADENRDEFVQELQQVHVDLKKHLREEDEFIYPMYKPPETYAYT